VAEHGWQSQREALGAFIRAQRKLARLSLRDLADRTDVSNPYLSQIERGLHEPSVRVLKSIARALNVSVETLLTQAGLLDRTPTGEADEATAATSGPGSSPAPPPAGVLFTEAAIGADPALTPAQREALLGVYRSYVAEGAARTEDPAAARPPATAKPRPRPRKAAG
jgi:transcriptional regulator with XRE-family HTH domain